jgi:hypothetical protein
LASLMHSARRVSACYLRDSRPLLLFVASHPVGTIDRAVWQHRG